MKPVDRNIIWALNVVDREWIAHCTEGEKFLGRPLTVPEAQWVGIKLAALWKRHTGLRSAPFAYLPKRFGHGTHLKGVYPPSWIEEIERLVREAASGTVVLEPGELPEDSIFDLLSSPKE